MWLKAQESRELSGRVRPQALNPERMASFVKVQKCDRVFWRTHRPEVTLSVLKRHGDAVHSIAGESLGFVPSPLKS